MVKNKLCTVNFTIDMYITVAVAERPGERANQKKKNKQILFTPPTYRKFTNPVEAWTFLRSLG